MFKTPINLNSCSEMQIKKYLLDSIDVILTDCDETLWHYDKIIPGAPGTINNLKELGKEIYFVTNNSTITRHDLWDKAINMGFNIEEDRIIAPTYSIAQYVKRHLKTGENVYVVGTKSIEKELNFFDIPSFGAGPDETKDEWSQIIPSINELSKTSNVGAVVVGFDHHFTYNKILKASSFLENNRDCLFLATNSDVVLKFPTFNLPGTGSIIKAIENFVDRQAIIMGKPNPRICEHIFQADKVNRRRILMIGDCCNIDLLFGKNCGVQTLLVGTGRYKWLDVEAFVQAGDHSHIPDFYINSFGKLEECLRNV